MDPSVGLWQGYIPGAALLIFLGELGDCGCFVRSKVDPKATSEFFEQSYSLLEKLTEAALGMCKRIFFVHSCHRG